MLALGTLLGTAFGMAAAVLFPQYHLEAGTFAIAGMGALMAASVRAPLTGIVLVLEMTDNYQLILPMIITCLGATRLAQFLAETVILNHPGAHSGEAGCGTGGEKPECACGREYLNELPGY